MSLCPREAWSVIYSEVSKFAFVGLNFSNFLLKCSSRMLFPMILLCYYLYRQRQCSYVLHVFVNAIVNKIQTGLELGTLWTNITTPNEQGEPSRWNLVCEELVIFNDSLGSNGQNLNFLMEVIEDSLCSWMCIFSTLLMRIVHKREPREIGPFLDEAVPIFSELHFLNKLSCFIEELELNQWDWCSLMVVTLIRDSIINGFDRWLLFW